MNIPVFSNKYASLPSKFHVLQAPVPVRAPSLFALNAPLAADLGLDPNWLASPQGLDMLSGNALPETATPLAQAYAGHQFGGWMPTLGDGRAILLGEVAGKDGKLYDLQLKGAGRTPFSRMGDGRAALGPVIREYLLSEAMAALGVPTTRALAVVATGEKVQRETALPGAILTRVATSHVRVGTFQYFAARGDRESLEALVNFVRARHFPDTADAYEMLDAIVRRQAALIAHWLSIGFIHGVMNTDNMAVSGETIDYGPCAFMDEYHPGRVFSSIDRRGRYAFANQPGIAGWNLAKLATALVPLLGDDVAVIERMTNIVNGFAEIFGAEWLRRFGAKIGLAAPQAEDQELIEALLSSMAENEADFTATFRALTEGEIPPFAQDWSKAWQARLAGQDANPTDVMARANPVIIPRNHRIAEAIEAAANGDRAPFDRLHRALSMPFADNAETAPYRAAPKEEERVTRTFCGT